MVAIGNLTAAGLWVGSVKADSAFIGNKQVWEATTPGPTYDGLTFTALSSGSTVKLVRDGSAPTVYLQYSTDGSNWDTYTTGNIITLSNVGDYVCFRATTTNAKFGGGSNSDRNRFAGTGQLKVSGNLYSILDGTDYNTMLDISGQDRILQFLFVGNTALVDAEDLLLPATKITGWAYCNMFEGCTSLVKGPKEISATDMSNSTNWPIAAMFYNCSALLDGPHIKATSFPNNCCVQMFDGCSSLSSITMDYTGSFGTGVFSNWVRGVAASGVFYYNGTSTTTGASYIPSGWTISEFPIIPTKVKYTEASGLPDWQGDIVGQIAGSSTGPTSRIPNVLSAQTIETGTHVTGIGYNAFANCQNISDVVMGNTVISTGTGSFNGCIGLSDVTFGTGLSAIGTSSFRNCISLSSITIPSNVVSIGQQAFYGCSNLSTVNWMSNTTVGIYNMTNYPWGLENGTTIHCSNGDLIVGQSPLVEVDYIDYLNTNVAEMVTDYTPNSTTWFEGRFRGSAVGNWFVGTTDAKWRGFNSTTTFYVDVNGMSRRISQSGWDTTKWYDLSAGNCFFTCVPDSGTTLSQTGTAVSVAYSKPLALGSSTYQWQGEYVKFDCAGFKVWEGNTLIKDYRPAKDENGVVCMYEEVSKTYCYPTNSGGTFIGYDNT